MADIVDKKTRSRMMSGIKGKDTKPEVLIRSFLHRSGFRFRLHVRDLPGRPDIVLPKYKAIIFVHGCFWHGHGCHLFKWPETRKEFWQGKINGNINVDQRAVKELVSAGWRVGIVWECAVKGKRRMDVVFLKNEVVRWLKEIGIKEPESFTGKV